MTRLGGVIFVCVAAGAAAAAAAAGCSSSSSSPVQPATEGGGPPGATADAEASDGAPKTLMLQWKVVTASSGDGGAAGTDAAASDGGASDGTPGNSDGGASDASTGDAVASVDEAGPAAEDADAVDAGDASNAISLATFPPLEGVQVCVYQNSAFPCVTTQADGTFMMAGLPVRGDLVLSFVKSGFTSYLVPIETASIDMDGRGNPILMDRPGSPPSGVTVDSTKGIIQAFAVQAGGADGGAFVGVMGTQIALSPMSGSGPYFLAPRDGMFDPTATNFVSDTAYYFNVDPGTYTLTYTNSAYDCEPISFPFGEFGFPVTSPAHSIKIVTAAGYTTGIVGVLCTVKPVIVAVDGG